MSESVAPDRYQPVLTWRLQAARYVTCVAISAFVFFTTWHDRGSAAPVAWSVDVVFGLAAYAAVPFRRRWPLAVALFTNAANAFSSIASGPSALASVSLATRRVWWHVILIGALGIGSSLIFVSSLSVQNSPFWLVVMWNAGVTAAMLGWGMFIGSRRELIYTLHERALKAEQERDLRVDSAKSAERARIAREMHDVLAHRISQVSMFAGALAFRDNLTVAEMRDSAAVIQAQANEALADLRSVLGVLRDGDGQILDKPQPTIADLEELVESTVKGGQNVAFDNSITDPADLSQSAGRAIYRIVQEGLTNARKHAPGAKVTVAITGSEADGVDIFVRNKTGFGSSPAAPGSGLGLVGMEERAQLAGGRLEHRVQKGEFVLHAWIPWSS
ncbi:MAG: histidine kinase [Nocardiaceae bacterium]|nr:histidine kinase [Nocardiaceae bacterium]